MKQFQKYIRAILKIIFPQKPGAVDFTIISPEEVWHTSPCAASISPPRFPARCRAALSYKYPRTRALIWQIKYKRDAAAITIGGYILYQIMARRFSNEKIVVVPIPVSPARRRERGYNQCELLAEAMLKNNPTQLTVRTDILFRTVHTKRQTLKNRSERLVAARGIFSIHKKFAHNENESLKHHHIVVIDDVLTTGSTLHEAITTLEKAGFEKVFGLTLAH